MDVSLLSHVNLNALQTVSNKSVTESNFASVLDAAEVGDMPDVLTSEALRGLLEDPNSSIPESIRTSLQRLFSEELLSEKELKKMSKQLSVYATGLADVVNFSPNATEVAQADFDLQVMMAGLFTMVDAYGEKNAMTDLLNLWKKLDTRSSSFESVEASLIDFSKVGTMDLSGRSDLVLSEKKQLTFDIQYDVWNQIMSYAHLDRSKTVLAAFEKSEQMKMVKLEFKGASFSEFEGDGTEGLST